MLLSSDSTTRKHKKLKHLALPVVTFELPQSFRFEKTPLNGARCTLGFVAGYPREFIFDSNVLGDGIRKMRYDYDVQGIPIYENHEYWQDLELIENFWKVPAFIGSLDSATINLESSIPSAAKTSSVIKTPESIKHVACQF